MTEFSMQAIVARRFGMLVDKGEQDKFTLDGPLTPEMIAYAAFDTRMPFSMRESQLREMTVDQLLTVAQIENDGIGAYQDMHFNGLRIDGPRWLKRLDAVVLRRKGELQNLDTEFIKVVGTKTGQIDFEEMTKREDKWRNGFELITPEEAAKADEIRSTRDNAIKATLRAELEILKKARKALKAEAHQKYLELSKLHTLVKNKAPDCEGDAFINYNSTKQLLEAIQKIRGFTTLKSVDDEALLAYNDKPFIQTLRKFRKGKKDTGTYGVQWAQTWITKACKEEGWVHPWDGRIHSVFNQLEAETGRSSSQKPSVMNLPKEDEVRACFICSPPDENIRISDCCDEDTTLITGDLICMKCGKPCTHHAEEYVLVTTDMSGAELRIIAELSGDPAWIKAFALGHDVHSVSTEILEPEKWAAGTVEGCAYFALDAEGLPKHLKCECPIHIYLRGHTKAINFLLCYGGGPDALADELGITVEAAKALMKQHERSFPIVWAYLKASGERAQRTNEARDLYGRRRQLPKPTWESSKEYFIEEHSDRLELDAEVQKQNIFNFEVAYLRKPTTEEKYSLTHRAPSESEIRQAMRGLHGSIGRRGKNHAIQGSNASIIKRSMGCGFDAQGVPFLWHSLPQYKAKLLSMIHDELVIEAPKRYGQKVAELVADAFKRAAAEVMTKVEMQAEWHIADRWMK
jgi:DNA polymerase I-like protein with 3'-5' exonuclease and polymerase domains